MAQSLGRSQECYVVAEGTYGTRGSDPAGTDQVPIISLRTPRNQELLVPEDKTGTRSRRQPIAGGAVEGTVQLECHMIPSGTPGTAPDTDLLVKNVLGAKNTAISTTVASATSGTLFAVASATNIAAGSILYIGTEARPVASISGTDVTMAVPFSSTPAGSAAVKGITYKCSDAVAEGLDVYNYDGQGNLNRVAEGVVIDQATFQIDTRRRILSMALSGLAKDVSTSTIAAKPTGATVGSPVGSSFGSVYIGTTAYSLFDMSIICNNNDSRRMIPVGSQNADGISRGVRDVSVSFRVYLDGNTASLYAAAVARTSKSLFVQVGTTSGYIWGFWLPTFVLQVPDPEFGDGDVIMEFSGNVAYSAGNTELYIGHH